jgi:CheY-like chemotaxis protein
MAQRLLLLADDEILIQRLLKPHLERAGYQTLIAGDGACAVDLAVSEQPHLIILDIMMPKVDGLEALRVLKSSEITKEIPVLIITSAYNQLMKAEIMASGAAGLLFKPFSPAQLLAEILRATPKYAAPKLS